MSEKNRDLGVVVVSIFLVVSFGIVLALMLGLGGGHLSGMMGYGWGFMFLIPTVFLVLIAIGIYYLIAGAIRQEKPVSDLGKKSLEILKQRYAKGEITREQFLIMRKELEL